MSIHFRIHVIIIFEVKVIKVREFSILRLSYSCSLNVVRCWGKKFKKPSDYHFWHFSMEFKLCRVGRRTLKMVVERCNVRNSWWIHLMLFSNHCIFLSFIQFSMHIVEWILEFWAPFFSFHSTNSLHIFTSKRRWSEVCWGVIKIHARTNQSKFLW